MQRLLAAGAHSNRRIAASLGIGPTAALACVWRAQPTNIGWPLPDDLKDDARDLRLDAGMATRDDTAIVQARPFKPRDKATVDVSGQVAMYWIIANLRNASFFPLSELSQGICDCVTALS